MCGRVPVRLRGEQPPPLIHVEEALLAPNKVHLVGSIEGIIEVESMS